MTFAFCVEPMKQEAADYLVKPFYAGGQRRAGFAPFEPEVVRVFVSIPEPVWENIRLEVAGPRVNVRPGMSVQALRDPASTGSAAR